MMRKTTTPQKKKKKPVQYYSAIIYRLRRRNPFQTRSAHHQERHQLSYRGDCNAVNELARLEGPLQCVDNIAEFLRFPCTPRLRALLYRACVGHIVPTLQG